MKDNFLFNMLCDVPDAILTLLDTICWRAKTATATSKISLLILVELLIFDFYLFFVETTSTNDIPKYHAAER